MNNLHVFWSAFILEKTGIVYAEFQIVIDKTKMRDKGCIHTCSVHVQTLCSLPTVNGQTSLKVFFVRL